MSMMADTHKGGDYPGRRPHAYVRATVAQSMFATFHGITNKQLTTKEFTL